MASQGPLQLKIGRKGNARSESNKHCFQVALRCHFTCEFNVVTECQENEAMFLRTEVQLELQDGPRNNTTVNYLDAHFTVRSNAHLLFPFQTSGKPVENQRNVLVCRGSSGGDLNKNSAQPQRTHAPLTSLNSFTVLKYSLCFSNNSKYWSFNWSLLILFSCFFFSICWNILGNSDEKPCSDQAWLTMSRRKLLVTLMDFLPVVSFCASFLRLFYLSAWYGIGIIICSAILLSLGVNCFI